MAETAGCTLATIRTAMNKAGLGGQPLPRRRRPPSARVAGLPPWPAAGEPVSDPNTCPGWENCLDDVDAPCAMLAGYGQP